MADVKISGLPASTVPLAGTEVLPIVQSGVTKKVAVSDLTAGRAISTTVLTSTVAIGTAPFVVTSTTNVANLNASSLNGATFAAPGAIGGTTASAITGTTITGTDTTEATSTTAAALKTAGGLAVAKKIYAGDNIVVVSGKGIDFSATAGTGTSELFNDYEEGTFTPVVTFLTPGDLSVVYSIQEGRYVKIGKRVFVDIRLATTTFTWTTASSAILITGLPFTSVNSTNYRATGSFFAGGITSVAGSAVTDFVLLVSSNATQAAIQGTGTSGTATAAATWFTSGTNLALGGSVSYETA